MFMLLLFAMPAIADQRGDICAQLAVRYTVILLFASSTKDKNEFYAFMYKNMLFGNTSDQEKKILVNLVENAWINRDKDVSTTAMTLYRECAKGDQT